MDEILRGQPDTLEVQVYDQNGEEANLDADPSLSVVDANGDAVATGTVTKPAGTGVYQATLAGQSDLTVLRADWTGALGGDVWSYSQRYEIVGNLLFTEDAARTKTITGLQTPLSDEGEYPDEDIARIRQQIVEEFERLTGKPWTRRYCRVEVCGTGTHILNLSRGEPRDSEGNQVGGPGRFRHLVKPISATIDGTAVTVSELRLSGRNLLHTNGVWTRGSISDPFNVVVEYEYGPDPVPREAVENGLRMAVANLVPSDVSGYAQSFSGPDGTVRYGPNGLAWPHKTWQWLKRNQPVLLA